MEKLMIDRKIWLRGEGSDNSFLLRPDDGKQCCLGIYLEQKGFTKEQLAGKVVPLDLTFDRGAHRSEVKLPEWMSKNIDGLGHSTDVDLLMELNDMDDDWKAVNRMADLEDVKYNPVNVKVDEEKLVAVFARNGIEVEFVN